MTGSKSPRVSGARRAESLERVCPNAQLLSCVQLFATPWSLTHQALLSMGFPRQEYWSGLPFSSSGDLSDPGIEPVSPALADRFFNTEPPGKPSLSGNNVQNQAKFPNRTFNQVFFVFETLSQPLASFVR